MDLTIWAGLLAVGTLLAFAANRRQRDAEVTRHAEARRRRECGVAIREFLARHGQAAAEVASREELRALIEQGAGPEELKRLLGVRLEGIGGTLLGHTITGGLRVPVRLPLRLRLRHALVGGKTGSGKSTLLTNVAVSDMEAGLGLGILGPEPESIRDILERVPEARWDDVVHIDPSDFTAPVVLNPLHLAPGDDFDRKIAHSMAIFQQLAGDENGPATPRLEAIARQGFCALTPIDGTTLLDLPKLLDRREDAFRRWVIGQLADEHTRHFWSEVYPSYPKDAHLSLVNRLERFLGPKAVRNLFCGSGRPLNLRRAMDDGRILLFAPSDGLLGPESAKLAGQLFVAELQLATMSRADLPPERRRPFMCVIDEFQVFCAAAASSYAAMLSRARKYDVGLILAHQQLGQVPVPLMREILGNVAVVVAFELGGRDARQLAKEFVAERDGEFLPIDAAQFLRLRVGEAICRIGRSVVKVATPPPAALGSARVRDAVIERSRVRYGAPASNGANRGRYQERPDLRGLDPRAVF